MAELLTKKGKQEVGEKVRELRQITDGRVKEHEFVRRYWVATAEQGTEVEDLLDPAYWAHIAPKFTQYDRIEARVDDERWFAEFLVLGVGKAWVKLFLLNKWDITSKDAIAPNEDFTIQHKGPHLKWCVIRKLDSERIHEQAKTYEEALAWLGNHLK